MSIYVNHCVCVLDTAGLEENQMIRILKNKNFICLREGM